MISKTNEISTEASLQEQLITELRRSAQEQNLKISIFKNPNGGQSSRVELWIRDFDKGTNASPYLISVQHQRDFQVIYFLLSVDRIRVNNGRMAYFKEIGGVAEAAVKVIQSL